MTEYSEKDLILPALHFISRKPGISTSELIVLLESMLLPEGEDLKILAGRNDSKFSQKVRNLVSHHTIDQKGAGYVKSVQDGRIWYHEITPKGLFYLEFNKNVFLKTSTEVGLTHNELIEIILRKMVALNGRASTTDIYDAVGQNMRGFGLSERGKTELKGILEVAINQNYVLPHFPHDQYWRITPSGRDRIGDETSGEGIDDELTESDDSESPLPQEPYDINSIRIDFTPFTVFQIMRKIRLGEINMQPAFQRHVIWDDTRQSRLIESILLRIPLPAFYLDVTNDENWLVVDGLQRLYTLDRFYNRNELALKNLEFLKDLDGSTYNNLPRNFQRVIEDHTKLNIYLIQPDTSPMAKFTIFYRINTGGLVLSAQEIRHALFQGPASKLLEQLANSTEFLKATSGSINTKRMDDRECALRFIAFYLIPYKQYLKPDLDGFLSQTMDRINKQTPAQIEKIRRIFLETMEKATDVFGEYAFRKIYEIPGIRYPISKSLFEAWAIALVIYPRESLVSHRNQILNHFVKVMNEDADFGKSISQGTGSIQNVHRRFGTIQNILAEIMK